MQSVSYDVAKDHLKPALGSGAGYVRREIERGVSKAYRLTLAPMFVVLRPEGETLVVVAVAGKNLAAAIIELESFAITRGFKFVRFHTKHPERLKKGLSTLRRPIRLIENRPRPLGRNELVYQVDLRG